VHVHAPEDFLIVFESAELRRHVAALPSVLVAGAPLVLRPWNRQAQAKQVPLSSKVFLILEGIPPHAWDVGVVEDLLGKSCAVDEVAPETRSRADHALFKLSAWTSEVDAIPTERLLAVPEPLREEVRPPARELPVEDGVQGLAPMSEIKTLQYRVLIHVVAVEEPMPVETELRPGAQGGGAAGCHGNGSQEGQGGDGGEGGRRRRRTLPWTRGVPDSRGGPGGFLSQRRCGTGGSVPVEAGASWGLSPLQSPGPWAVQTASGSESNLAAAGGPRQKDGGSRGKAAGDQATVGSRAAAPSCGVEVEKVVPMEEAAENIRSVGQLMETDHAVHVMGRQDAMDSLASVAADPEADPVGLSVELPPARGEGPMGLDPESLEGSVKESLAATPCGFGHTKSGPTVGPFHGAMGISMKGSSTEEACTPLVSGAGMPLVESAGSSTDSCAKRLEGYFQVSVSEKERIQVEDEVVVGSSECPGRAHIEQLELLDSDPVVSPCTSYTGPNRAMQMVPRRARVEPVSEEGEPEVGREETAAELALQQERLALCRIKMFCASILKKLAPPLLREVESSSSLRAEAQPFTPRRLTRSAAMMVVEKEKKAPKASAAESVLLKALGICPEELSVDEEHLASFTEIFDSPLGERHVRV
jgi:hypothetical protein